MFGQRVIEAALLFCVLASSATACSYHIVQVSTCANTSLNNKLHDDVPSEVQLANADFLVDKTDPCAPVPCNSSLQPIVDCFGMYYSSVCELRRMLCLLQSNSSPYVCPAYNETALCNSICQPIEICQQERQCVSQLCFQVFYCVSRSPTHLPLSTVADQSPLPGGSCEWIGFSNKKSVCISSQSVSWSTARHSCEQKGGQLLQVESLWEWTLFDRMVNMLSLPRLWVENSGHFSAMPYEDRRRHADYCVTIRYIESRKSTYLAQRPCHSQYRFICQISTGTLF